MIPKKITSLGIAACIIFGGCINVSYALDDDEFLKFLINTSYPETKLEQPKEESSKDDNKADKKEESKDTKENSKDKKADNKEEDFIKPYVGVENLPQIETKSEEGNESAVASMSSGYVDNVLVTKDQPQILVYHTHGGETYTNSPEGNYHSEDKANSTLEIGALLTKELAKKGRGVVHNTTYHDIPEFIGAYSRSLKTIEAMQAKYDSLDIIVDLHRDGRDFNKIPKAEFHDLCTTNMNGESVAKFCFVVGEKSENYQQNLKLAQEITAYAESKYPGITRPVVTKDNGRYNQYKSDNPLLIEVGGNANTIEEAKASVKYIADVIDGYFKQKGM